MKRALKIAVVAAMAACIAACLAACGGAQQSTSATTHSSSEELSVKETVSTEPFYALIIGGDSRYNTAENPNAQEGENCYSDVIMLARIDPQSYRISLLSIPRDSGTMYNGELTKINDAYYIDGGPGLTEAVAALTGVRASYYFDTAFFKYTQLVDGLGGALADVPFEMSLGEPITGGTVHLYEGDNQTLKGTDALGLGRMRKEYQVSGEACRQIRNRQIVENFIRKVAAQDPSEAPEYADLLLEFAGSNMDADTLTQYVQMFMENADKITFNSGTGPYEGDESTGTWLVPMDTDLYAQLIGAMESGEPLTDIMPLPEVAKAVD